MVEVDPVEGAAAKLGVCRHSAEEVKAGAQLVAGLKAAELADLVDSEPARLERGGLLAIF